MRAITLRRNNKAKFYTVIVVGILACMLCPSSYAEVGPDWTQATDSADWSPRSMHSSVVFDGKIWVMGGRNDACQTMNDVWYSSDGVNWTQATALANWSPRRGHTSVVFNNKMWVLGGSTEMQSSGHLNDVWYSSDGINWTQATASADWSPRKHHTSVVHDGRMWVIGGYETPHAKNDVWYSSDGVNWTQATASADWVQRFEHTSVVHDGRMWVLGGLAYSGSGYLYLANPEIWYSSDGVNWTEATSPTGRGFGRHTSVVHNGYMWILGAGNGNTIYYSADGADWDYYSSSVVWSARQYHASATFSGKMWVMGGGFTSPLLNDVWYSSGLGKAEAVNPQSSESFYDSFFPKPDPAGLASGGSLSSIIAADGESRLLLRFFSDEPVSVTVAVEGADPANGSLSDLNGYLNAGWDDTSVTVSVDHPYGEGYVGYAVYRAPRDFTIPGCEDKLTRPASLAINHPGGTETLSLTIRRPPIFLSHGLWSLPDVLEDFKNDLWNRFSDTGGKNIDDFIRANDGRVVNAAHFDAGAAKTKSNIRDYLKDLRQRGSTVTQVDYMGHSMGGIWGRLVKQIYPQDVFTYDKGYINKIITVDTPHLGSFLADLGDIIFDAADGDYDIWGMGNIKDALCTISSIIHHPMCDGAVEDLTAEGCVDLLEDVYLPSHSVVGNKYIDTACLLLSLSDRIPDASAKAAAKLFKVMEMILKMINSDWGCENWINLLDVPTYTDYVVSLTSQKGGLDEPFEVSEFNMWHMACYNEDVNGEVLDLLNTSVDDPVFADYFDAAGDLVSLEYLMNLEQLKQKARKKSIRPRAPLSVDAGIAFVTPSDGEVISPGDTVDVEITTTGGLTLESLLVIDPYSDPVDITSPPYTTSFNVPLDAYGSYSLTALGEGTDGELYGAEVTLDVDNPATLVSLEVSPETLFIDTGGAVGVSVMGEFTDGSLRNLSKGSTGTTYESGNIGIVTVDANGTCTGISAGTADVTVHHGAQPAVTVAAKVAQPYINAGFTADKYVGSLPLAVNFTDISAGYIDQWQWSFGDGGTSTDQNPSHTYSHAGNYTVTLTVTGPGGPDSDTEVIVVTGVPNEPGDANGDGGINVQDVIGIINNILGTGTASGSPDCNEDGSINVQDVICVINKILGG